MLHKVYKKVVLVVLDGFGVASLNRGNAIAYANPEVFNYIVSNFPSLSLQASGPLVGLPWGEMGNSEVGHLNIGAGRIIGQDQPRITAEIQSGEFFKNPAFLKVVEHVKKNHSKLHLIGMVSPGGVHSLEDHLFALLGLAKENELEQVYIHMFTDGRDTAEKVALDSLTKLKSKIDQIGIGVVATIAGRFYGMDRGGHWEQTESTYKSIVEGIGDQASTPEEAVINSYHQAVYDEMIKPTVMIRPDTNGNVVPIAKVEDNDGIIFFNFRQDRALQLTQAFTEPEKTGLPKEHKKLNGIFAVTMTEYRADLGVEVAFKTVEVPNSLGEVIDKTGLTQFHIAESEKYAHVTSFFNCGRVEPWSHEQRFIVKSPVNSNNYKDKPQMSAPEITSVLVEKVTRADFNFYVANFANGDMVGHTGDFNAAVEAVRSLDIQMKLIMDAVLSIDAVMIITADHGNVEQMIGSGGEIDKDHTTNPVPFLLISNEFKFPKSKQINYVSLSSRVPDGVISDIAPTVLSLLGLPKPPQMSGINLLSML